MAGTHVEEQWIIKELLDPVFLLTCKELKHHGLAKNLHDSMVEIHDIREVIHEGVGKGGTVVFVISVLSLGVFHVFYFLDVAEVFLLKYHCEDSSHEGYCFEDRE